LPLRFFFLPVFSTKKRKPRWSRFTSLGFCQSRAVNSATSVQIKTLPRFGQSSGERSRACFTPTAWVFFISDLRITICDLGKTFRRKLLPSLASPCRVVTGGEGRFFGLPGLGGILSNAVPKHSTLNIKHLTNHEK
jgi:hypothetical protein